MNKWKRLTFFQGKLRESAYQSALFGVVFMISPLEVQGVLIHHQQWYFWELRDHMQGCASGSALSWILELFIVVASTASLASLQKPQSSRMCGALRIPNALFWRVDPIISKTYKLLNQWCLWFSCTSGSPIFKVVLDGPETSSYNSAVPKI